MTQLRELWFESARLSGPIPVELGQLTNLELLVLRDNSLSGRLPGSLANLQQLGSLILSYNHELYGFIPREYSSLPLTALYFHNTRLCPPPDEEFQGWLKENVLAVWPFTCGSTPFSDELALRVVYDETLGDAWEESTGWLEGEDLGEWHGVTVDGDGYAVALELPANELAGELPVEVAYLSRLRRLDLRDNGALAGELPEIITKTLALEHLDLEGTGLCAPDGVAFDIWLGRIETGRVARCSG